MKIKIICVGKLKEKYLAQGVNEYLKRLSRYVAIDIIELPDEKVPENIGESLKEQIKAKEGDRILKAIPKDSYCVALVIEEEQLSSKQLARKIQSLENNGVHCLCLIIGGSIGLGEEILKRADYKLSFSKFTFPHQLMRLILLEQIYRAYRINSNHPYHK